MQADPTRSLFLMAPTPWLCLLSLCLKHLWVSLPKGKLLILGRLFEMGVKIWGLIPSFINLQTLLLFQHTSALTLRGRWYL